MFLSLSLSLSLFLSLSLSLAFGEPRTVRVTHRVSLSRKCRVYICIRVRKYIYTYTQTHKHARVHALARAASSGNSLFSWYRGISFSRRSLSRSFLINLGGKETRGTRITARNEVAERGAETRRQVATSRVSLLSTVDERRYRFPRGPHMDDDDSRKKTRENRSHVSWRAKHFCGEDGFFFFFFYKSGRPNEKEKKEKGKKSGVQRVLHLSYVDTYARYEEEGRDQSRSLQLVRLRSYHCLRHRRPRLDDTLTTTKTTTTTTTTATTTTTIVLASMLVPRRDHEPASPFQFQCASTDAARVPMLRIFSAGQIYI